MPGLYLNSNAAASGSYTPGTPASASSSSSANNATKAFGISSIPNGGAGDGSAAGMGSVSIGVIALTLMTFIWYSLPR